MESPIVKQERFSGSNRKPTNQSSLTGSRPYGRDDMGIAAINQLTTYGGSKHFLSASGVGPNHVSSPLTSPFTKQNPGVLASPQ